MPPTVRGVLRDDFLWGAATAAHQIEGNNVNADFWAAEHAGLPHLKEPSGDACDSYHRFGEDIRLLAEAGLKAYRFSIEWARIEPERGHVSRAELLHYRDMIDTCHAFGVEPIITLHHFTSPRWFASAGGFMAPDAVERFSAYVAAVCPILHDVNWVVTVNEPNILALFSRMTATPEGAASEGAASEANGAGEAGSDQTATVAMAQLPMPSLEFAARIGEVHRAAVRILRDQTAAKVGWAVAAQAFTPTEGNEAVFEKVFHAWEGAYYEASAGDDFVGIQAYTSQPVDANGPVPHPPSPENSLAGWAYRPDALGINVARVWEKYGLPIFVTENGIATDDDTRRIAYTTGALQGMKDAVADGAEVLGYTHWSLLDNYEWGSYTPTFGLIAVNRAGDFERTPKPSLAWLGRVAASNGEDLG
ncbi:glycoside hydrolase family 1 protein [Propioniciclava soli]|uniref:glycoside hydrolase family 1 protein n=1 Tax=Propioniciclava soli TaxID=2775081 RepID=UPI001E537874